MAATIIEQINRIHSDGNGLSNLSGTLSSTNLATDAVTALNVAGLPFNVSAGSFTVTVYDSSGAVTGSGTITITPGTTTLTTLATDLSAFSGDFSATVTNGNTLDMTAAAGSTFTLSSDTSGALTALGVNGLFTGSDAHTIGVNVDIKNDPNLLVSALSTDPLNTGDNTAALQMAAVPEGLFLVNNTTSIGDFYESIIVGIGVDAQSNLRTVEVQGAFLDSIERRRQQVSGVSIDEEVTFLLQFQRAFQASARIITVTDRMLETLLNVIR
jgi:flagellar hook-associated protein 1 FlgK